MSNEFHQTEAWQTQHAKKLKKDKLRRMARQRFTAMNLYRMSKIKATMSTQASRVERLADMNWFMKIINRIRTAIYNWFIDPRYRANQSS